MSFDRKEFLTLLNEVKPALAGKSDIPGLDAIWFTENSVSAYNGVIQIRTPLAFAYAISGGVPGDVLIKFVASCSTETMELNIKKGFNLKAGKADLKLALLEPSQNACEFPEIDPKELGIQLSAEVGEALGNCLISTNKNSTNEGFAGIMIEPAEESAINMFSTDGKTLSWESVTHESFDAWEAKLLLPAEFCSQLLRLADKDTFFLADEGYASIKTGEGISLTTRLLDTEGAPRYARAITTHLERVDDYHPIPADLRSALERCELIKPDRGDDPVTIEINDGQMMISIKTTIGQAHDEIETTHPDVKIVLDSGLLLRAIDNYVEFAITEDAFVLHGDGTSYHLISALQD